MFTENDDNTTEAQIAQDVGNTAIDSPARVRGLRTALVGLSPSDRLKRLRERMPGRIVFMHGFGIEGQLVLHWICERDIDIDIATLDTGRLFPETYELWALTEARYGRPIRAVYPDPAALESYVGKHGINGFYSSQQAREACCTVRKTSPLERALSGASAWVSALRADQSSVRRDDGLVRFEASRGMVKLNPLFDWTREAVLDEIKAHDIPVNTLHARGFASIGCAPCTRAIKPGDDERSGRWWWEGDGPRECGLHMPHRAAASTVAAVAGCG
jgi:phosphoadenosine phosphosulfate reductase